jgi:uncharacterized protein YabE (DUF348 family)
MKIHSARTFLILLAVCALAAPMAFAGDAKVVGTWDAVAVTPEGDMPALLTITETDSALEATMDIGGMERVVKDVKLEGDVLTMTVMYDGAPYDVELKVDGDTMEGTYSGAMATGELKATRKP